MIVAGVGAHCICVIGDAEGSGGTHGSSSVRSSAIVNVLRSTLAPWHAWQAAGSRKRMSDFQSPGGITADGWNLPDPRHVVHSRVASNVQPSSRMGQG